MFITTIPFKPSSSTVYHRSVSIITERDVLTNPFCIFNILSAYFSRRWEYIVSSMQIGCKTRQMAN